MIPIKNWYMPAFQILKNHLLSWVMTHGSFLKNFDFWLTSGSCICNMHILWLRILWQFFADKIFWKNSASADWLPPSPPLYIHIWTQNPRELTCMNQSNHSQRHENHKKISIAMKSIEFHAHESIPLVLPYRAQKFCFEVGSSSFHWWTNDKSRRWKVEVMERPGTTK